MDETADIIAKLRMRFEADDYIRFALLFGSFSAGSATPSSDVDVAVAAEGPIPLDVLVDYGLEISDLLEREVDIVDLCESHGSSLEEPMMKGLILTLKDPAVREKLLGRMMREHEDDGRVNDVIFRERLARWGK